LPAYPFAVSPEKSQGSGDLLAMEHRNVAGAFLASTNGGDCTLFIPHT
jgi:hypothetical protein